MSQQGWVYGRNRLCSRDESIDGTVYAARMSLLKESFTQQGWVYWRNRLRSKDESIEETVYADTFK